MSVWGPVIATIPPLLIAAAAWLRANTAHKQSADTAQTVQDHLNSQHGQ